MADEIKQLPKTPTLPPDTADGGKSLVRALWDHIIQSNETINKLIKAVKQAADYPEITPEGIGALPNTTTAEDMGALPNTTTPADIGAAAANAIPSVHFAITPAERQTIASVNPVLVNGLEITITPKSVNSKFLIMAVVNGTMTHVASSLIYRNGFPVLTHTGNTNEPGAQATTYYGNDIVTNMLQHTMNYMDAPQTIEPVTYDVRCTAGWSGTAHTLYINDRNTSDMRTPSTLTIIEFAGD